MNITASERGTRFRVTNLWVVAAGFLAGLSIVSGDPRLTLGAAFALVVVMFAFRFPHSALVAMIVYAGFLGSFRRIATWALNQSTDIDPLIGALPAVAIVLLVVIATTDGIRFDTIQSRLVGILFLIAVLGMFNPEQGPLTVGVLGLAFFGLPLLWFFVGRSLLDDRTMRRVMVAIAFVGVVSSVYAIFQWRGWMSPYDALWVKAVQFTGQIDGQILAFSTFSSTGEAARYLGAAAFAMFVGIGFRGRALTTRLAVAIGGSIIVFGMLVVGVRGALILTAGGAAAVVAARARLHLVQALGILAIGMVVMVLAAQIIQSTGIASDAILDRQVSGLANPFSGEASTYDKRESLFVGAFTGLASSPLGRGTGITTPSAAQYGDEFATTETDIGDVAVSWGIPGLVVYAWILVNGAIGAFQVARRRNDRLALATLGILCAASIQWINGGLYALSMLSWLLLGWVDREVARLAVTDAQAELPEHADRAAAVDPGSPALPAG